MVRSVSRWASVLAVCLAIFFTGCGEDSTSPGAPTVRFDGIWELEGQITARRVCDRAVGTAFTPLLQIAQRGNVVHLYGEFTGATLTVSGNRATGRRVYEFEGGTAIEFVLVRVGDELEATLTFTDPVNDCTEVSVSRGGRVNADAPSGMAGVWEFERRTQEAGCENSRVGDVERFCSRVEVRESTVTVLDSPEGELVGIFDDDEALLRSPDELESPNFMRIGYSRESLNGTFRRSPVDAQCVDTGDVSTVRRESPCVDDQPRGDFVGSWEWTVESLTTPNPCGLQFGPDCSEFVQNGDLVTIVSDGIQGVVEGNVLNARVEELLEGTTTLVYEWTLELQPGGQGFTGVVSIGFSDIQNSSLSCESRFAITGTRTLGCDAQ